MVSDLSIFCSKARHFLVLVVILSYLVRSYFSTPGLVVHSCLLGFLVLTWLPVETTGLCYVFSLLFSRGLVV